MKRVGLYSGTFDPVTYGHIDIIRRAFRLVDHLVVGIGVNSSKTPLLSFEDRAALIEAETKRLAMQVKAEIDGFKAQTDRAKVQVAAQEAAANIDNKDADTLNKEIDAVMKQQDIKSLSTEELIRIAAGG